MKKHNVSNFNRNLRGLVGILSASAIVGCADQNNHTSYGPQFFGFGAKLAGANSPDPKVAANSAVLGDALYLDATLKNQTRVALQGSERQLDLNGYEPQLEIQTEPDRFFSCNYFRDLDHNRIATDNEFIGTKNRFSSEEPIAFVAHMHNAQNKPFRFELRNEENQIIVTREFPGSSMNSFFTDTEGEFAPRVIKPGNYRGVWYLNGYLAGSSKITVSQD